MDSNYPTSWYDKPSSLYYVSQLDRAMAVTWDSKRNIGKAILLGVFLWEHYGTRTGRTRPSDLIRGLAQKSYNFSFSVGRHLIDLCDSLTALSVQSVSNTVYNLCDSLVELIVSPFGFWKGNTLTHAEIANDQFKVWRVGTIMAVLVFFGWKFIGGSWKLPKSWTYCSN